VDGFYTFALGGAFWDTSINKFALSSPVIMGNFPAYALLYRRGDVKEAPAVVAEELNIHELFAMKGSGGASAQAFDALREADIPPGQQVTSEVKGFDPLSFYVGKVEREFNEDNHQTTYTNITKNINRDEKIITSFTNELTWDYGDGLARVDTPKCQAVTGFLKQAGSLQFSGITITCTNEYASIAVIALDDLPIAQSKKLLIQTMTTERPFGFRASDGNDGTITELGGYPFGVEKIDASVEIRFNNNTKAKVIALDENGMATDKVVKVSSPQQNAVLITLDEDSVYHVVERKNIETGMNWMMKDTQDYSK
jgi:hypothetical protein